jgi:pimeloyl-ACP methyl ester carboxylesterase
MQVYLDLGGAAHAPIAHLAPANGFPPETYRPFATALATRHHVLGYRPRPLHPNTDPQAIASWHPLADDLAAAAARLSGPLLGVGHSLGAILTIYAALRLPGRFRALALCEPVLMPRRVLLPLWLMRRLGQQWRFPLAQSAARRRDYFPNVDEARAHYGRRSFFANFTPAAMDGYLEGGLRPAQHGGLTLAWPRGWEARIFSLVPIDAWDALYKLRIPVLIVRGKRSDLLTEATMRELRRIPHVTACELDAGHMLPMEHPVELAQQVLDWDRSS